MILLNPKKLDWEFPNPADKKLMLDTVGFFENKGRGKTKKDDHERVWYQDFLDFQRDKGLFSTLLTPASYGGPGSRWDTWRNCEFNEILAFYGLAYWYTWQVSILGLGPIWMSQNEAVKKRTAELLREGGIFAFGLSEKEHGADLYSTEMSLAPRGDGKYLANGRKYYIGNANQAAMVSTFGKFTDSGDYVFFAVGDSQREVRGREERGQLPELRGRVRAHRISHHRRRDPHHGARRLGRRPQHRQRRQVQPRLGVDRHLHPRLLRGHRPRRFPARPLRQARHGFPHVKPALRRRLHAPGRHEALRPARRRLHALGLARGPALPALQPHGEDEGHHPGRGGHQPAVGRHRRQGLREGHLLRDGGARHPRAAQAGGDGARQHRPDPQVHAQLLLQPRPVPGDSQGGRYRGRHLPFRPGADQGPGQDPVPRLQHRLRERATCPT